MCIQLNNTVLSRYIFILSLSLSLSLHISTQLFFIIFLKMYYTTIFAAYFHTFTCIVAYDSICEINIVHRRQYIGRHYVAGNNICKGDNICRHTSSALTILVHHYTTKHIIFKKVIVKYLKRYHMRAEHKNTKNCLLRSLLETPISVYVFKTIIIHSFRKVYISRYYKTRVIVFSIHKQITNFQYIQ